MIRHTGYHNSRLRRLSHQLGFSNTVFVFIVALIIFGVGGGIFWKLWRDISIAPESRKAVGMNKESVDRGGAILLLADTKLKDQLDQEFAVYSADVAREYGFKTIVRYVLPSENFQALKSYIIEIYNSGNLQGVMLVGDIPTAKLVSPEEAGEDSFEFGDYVYQDVFNNCAYLSKKQAFSSQSYGCTPVDINYFWVARLTPNSSTESSVALLKDYFRRNHAYRTGQYTYQKNSLWYTPLLLDSNIFTEEHKREVQTKINAAASFLGIYGPAEYHIVNVDSNDSDQDYLDELKKPSGYEFVYYNGHGSPTHHGRDLPSEKISQANFFYAEFSSCSVGRFNVKNYVAGQYLFSGGLIVIAASIPILAPDVPTTQELNFLLTKGLPFYEAIRISGIHHRLNILGDPTLRMRYDKKSLTRRPTDPGIEFSNENLALSSDQPVVNIKVKNYGGSVLRFLPKGKFYRHKDLRSFTFFSFYTSDPVKQDDNGLYYLNPGQEGNITIDMNFFSPPLPVGTYHGEFFILSNDPTDPYEVIPVDIKKDRD